MAIQQILLHLSLLEGIGPALVSHLIDAANKIDGLHNLYTMSVSDVQFHFGIGFDKAQVLVNGLANVDLLQKELALIAKYNVNWCTLLCDEYPVPLKEIYLPPTVLYWRGKAPNSFAKSIAFVGSRKANTYGQRAIKQLVPPLVARGWTIVSGGALGIDTLSHEQVVQEGGNTIVVLGSGLVNLYPLRNRSLFCAVVESGGTVLSTFGMTMPPLSGNFPARNRVIAGLSAGCVVVQAAQKSGAKITAQFALEQGREVFAVPGPIDDLLSVGCHALLQEGATLVSCAQDIVHVLEGDLVLQPARQTTIEQFDITTPEGKILSRCDRPISVDQLVRETNLDFMLIQEQLFALQLAGKVQQNFSGQWERI